MIVSSKKVKNLGVLIDHDMSIELCKNLYVKIKKINSIWSYLNERVTKTLVTSFILSKLDYYNTLRASLPKDPINPLQIIQNTAARLIMRSRKLDHILYLD